MKIVVFIEGTTFKTRFPMFLFTKYGYKPIGNAVDIVNTWKKEGHDIYLCSYVRKRRYNFVKRIIDFYGMKYTEILCREKGEQYSEIVERIKPDILIEDDCKSIGGQKEWCITNVREEIKAGIYSIIVPEFKGIDDVKIDE
uniref:hypothetical protein n=1 Tax=Agathobacter sp. TaxID=2021311 RepID=UPI004057A7C3